MENLKETIKTKFSEQGMAPDKTTLAAAILVVADETEKVKREMDMRCGIKITDILDELKRIYEFATPEYHPLGDENIRSHALGRVACDLEKLIKKVEKGGGGKIDE